MLTSSDAKFRCLWHMFIWSILLTIISQFYLLSDHIAFYIFGSICILVLPIVTSLYSNTAGRRGAGLLRVAYVLCDPVLACMALVPVLLIKRLTPLIREMECLSADVHSWNESISCLRKQTFSTPSQLQQQIIDESMPFKFKTVFWLERRQFLTAIELSVVIPCILALLMGRRTRKMNNQTMLLVFLYWLVGSIECCGMIEASVLCGSERLHYAVTTEVTVAVACILANSYGLVTLCSYLSPMQCKGDRKEVAQHFDFVYKCVVGVLGLAFVELPQLIARIQMMVATSDWPSSSEINYFIKENRETLKLAGVANKTAHEDLLNQTAVTISVTQPLRNISSLLKEILSKLSRHHLSTSQPPITTKSIDPTSFSPFQPAIQLTTTSYKDLEKFYHQAFPSSFYLWAFKDAIMMIFIILLLFFQRCRRGTAVFMKALRREHGCVGTVFDNLNTVFMPEKRDHYIITRCAKCKQIDLVGDRPHTHKNHYRSITHSSSNSSHISYRRASKETSYQHLSKPATSTILLPDRQLAETSFMKPDPIKRNKDLVNETDDFKVELNEELRDQLGHYEDNDDEEDEKKELEKDEDEKEDEEVNKASLATTLCNKFTTQERHYVRESLSPVDDFTIPEGSVTLAAEATEALNGDASSNRKAKKSVKFSFS